MAIEFKQETNKKLCFNYNGARKEIRREKNRKENLWEHVWSLKERAWYLCAEHSKPCNLNHLVEEHKGRDFGKVLSKISQAGKKIGLKEEKY